MAQVAYMWCKGSKFAELCQMTDIFEGSVVRCLRRIDELLQQLVQAATTIGTDSLVKKFSEASTRIKRDVVFAASLYL